MKENFTNLAMIMSPMTTSGEPSEKQSIICANTPLCSLHVMANECIGPIKFRELPENELKM